MTTNSGDTDRIQEQVSGRPAASRVAPFADIARRRTAGEMVLLPSMLTGNDRRTHVRPTVREDQESRIATHNEEAQEKFERLTGSMFAATPTRACGVTPTRLARMPLTEPRRRTNFGRTTPPMSSPG